MNSWFLYSHPVLLLRLKDTVSLSQHGRERRHSQDARKQRGKNQLTGIKSFNVQLPKASGHHHLHSTPQK